MGLIGAGDLQPYSPAYCLLAQLVGIRSFLDRMEPPIPPVKRIQVHVLDDEAWLPLAHGRLPAAELLSTGLARVLVRITDARGHSEEFALSVPHQTTVKDVLTGYVPGNPEGKQITVTPLTSMVSTVDTSDNELNDREHALKMRVFPGMIVGVRPKPQSPVPS